MFYIFISGSPSICLTMQNSQNNTFHSYWRKWDKNMENYTGLSVVIFLKQNFLIQISCKPSSEQTKNVFCYCISHRVWHILWTL